jgi:hypothetical protein
VVDALVVLSVDVDDDDTLWLLLDLLDLLVNELELNVRDDMDDVDDDDTLWLLELIVLEDSDDDSEVEVVIDWLDVELELDPEDTLVVLTLVVLALVVLKLWVDVLELLFVNELVELLVTPTEDVDDELPVVLDDVEILLNVLTEEQLSLLELIVRDDSDDDDDKLVKVEDAELHSVDELAELLVDLLDVDRELLELNDSVFVIDELADTVEVEEDSVMLLGELELTEDDTLDEVDEDWLDVDAEEELLKSSDHSSVILPPGLTAPIDGLPVLKYS